MKASKLYNQLENDFIKPGLTDDWAPHMDSVAGFLSDNFKNRSMGLVCDFTDEINKVYTAVFPTDDILQKILSDGIQNAMLFVHHPSIWDITKAPEVFQQMNTGLLQKFKDNHIAIYNLHVPLDNFGDYSTSVTLAKALGFEVKSSFAPYFGALCGVICHTDLLTIQDLKAKFEKAIDHASSLYNYGESKINNASVAVVAGGGNSPEILREVADAEINTFVTGITVKNDHSKDAHDYAEEHRINILGGTHYSTETFACQAMVKYFKKLNLLSEFIEGEPGMADL